MIRLTSLAVVVLAGVCCRDAAPPRPTSIPAKSGKKIGMRPNMTGVYGPWLSAAVLGDDPPRTRGIGWPRRPRMTSRILLLRD